MVSSSQRVGGGGGEASLSLMTIGGRGIQVGDSGTNKTGIMERCGWQFHKS